MPVRRRRLVLHGTDVGGQVVMWQAPFTGTVLPLRSVEVVRRPSGVPRIRQGVSQEPASGSLDTADYVAPDRLHGRSLPYSGPPAKRIWIWPVLRDDEVCRPLGSPHLPHRLHRPLASGGGTRVVCPYPHLAGLCGP